MSAADRGSTSGNPRATPPGGSGIAHERARPARAAFLVDLGSRAAAGARPGELIDAAVSGLPAVLRVDLIAIWRFDSRIDRVALEYGSGWSPNPPPVPIGAEEMPLLLPSAAVAFSAGPRRRGWDRARRPDTHFTHAPGVLATAGVRSGVVAPLTGHGRRHESIGAYARSPREFGAEEVKLLATVAELIGAARARMRGQRLDAELDVTRRQASVGALVANIAHDFNNMISVMVGRARLLDPETVDPAEIREAAAEIEAAGRAAGGLARSLVDLSRPLRTLPERVDVRPVIEEVVALMAGLVGKCVDLVAEIEEDAVVVMPPGELDRVLVNLIANARDAIDGRGSIVVSLEPKPHPGVGTAQAVVIAVRDDGMGMKPDILSRALEPSFTTKPAGEGSGIGLAAAATIVRGAGGEIELQSTPGAGTTVRVSLPVAGTG